MKSRENLKILLIQIRRQSEVKDFEYNCYLKFSGLAKENIKSVDTFKDKINNELLAGIDCLIIAGSEESVLDKKLRFIAPLEQLVKNCQEQSIPILGICFGHQLVAQALGGEVIHDKEHEEVGSFTMKLREAARYDKLFCQFPNSFLAQFSHEYCVHNLPAGLEVLASTDNCGAVAYRVIGENIYGVQFHPDRDKECMLERLNFFTQEVDDFGMDLKAIRSRVKDTPIADTFIAKFINTILLNNK